MKPEPNSRPAKRSYGKPKLRVIQLSADEVLATGCKTSPVTTGFGSNLCTSGVCSNTTGS
jgi:hypothetical protein